MKRHPVLGSSILLVVVLGAGFGLASWKMSSIQEANAASAHQPEYTETITVASAKERQHRQTTTSIGTVLATQSITLRNELSGTVKQVILQPGAIVEAGTLLVALDVSVEQAELKALEAQAALAKTTLDRLETLIHDRAVPQQDVDRASAERDVALANIARNKAIIARKTIRAPFRSRVGLSDVHIGQYLNEGTELTTLQGVDDTAYVDFSVAQQVAAGLKPGDSVDIFATTSHIAGEIVAVDSRIDHTTRNAMVRAKINNSANSPSPGASVRVEVPVGESVTAVAIPVSALRKGPGGDQVYVIEPDKDGNPRAHVRQVQSGMMLGDDVLILAGLSSGEQVAASGSFKLHEQALVAVASETVADANGSR